MSALNKLFKALGILVVAIILLAGGLFAYLTIVEYRPDDVEALTVTPSARNNEAQVGKMLTFVSFNTGYASLDRTQDFFMDGGKGVRPDSEEEVRDNLTGILNALSLQNADVCLLQEVDDDSYRSYYVDQAEAYRHGLSMNMAFAYNYKCDFVPVPWPPICKVSSGLATYTNLDVTEATRESLPCPFTWPMRIVNLKRCLLIERVPVANSDKELVIINLHLEAYDDGVGKAAQTKQLMETLKMEYRNGNYVVAGGDFNQTFENVTAYPVRDTSLWTPGQLHISELPKGFSFQFDQGAPTCRLLNKPYDGDRENTQFFVIDGFIVSDNLKVNHVETIDLNFQHSDHNPVLLKVTLK